MGDRIGIRFVREYDILADLHPTRFYGRYNSEGRLIMEGEAGGPAREWTGAAQAIAGEAVNQCATDESETDYRLRRMIDRILEDRKRGSEALTLSNVEEAFRYHPWNAAQTECGEAVRDVLVLAAKQILRSVPPGAYRTRVLNLLIDARMLANAAITFRGRF